MSVMTKYLKQTAELEVIMRNDDGSFVLDGYGQPSYEAPITVQCRKEPYVARGMTGYGQFSNYSTTYYLDDTIILSTRADDIKNKRIGRLDGAEIQYVSEYRNGSGTLVGYEVQV